ncbi:hypothetical protein P8452_53845 [Trifolium repens]|nr:hypothetical protein P8452_53845 [Trifolium repens]
MLLFCLYYLDIWGGIDTCPTCLNKRQEEQEKLESKFLELKEKNLESKAILLLRLQRLKESWESLSPADMEALETEAATQNKKPITIHEEQFAATFDMNGEWAELDLEMKIDWMESAELVLPFEEKGTSSNQISVEDRYTHWKSQIHTHYDWLTNHDLVWPSESCRWGALLEAQTNNNCYRLYFSENTNSTVKNTLVVATAEVVKPGVTGAEQFKVEALSPFVKTQKTILPYKAVRKIRELPSDSNIVATLADNHYICIWNVETQHEHEDSLYALAMFSSDPFILSRGRDKNARLWSLNDRVETKRHIKSRGSYEGHKGTVHDVKFYPSRYDARVGYDPTVKIEKAHDGIIRSVDWNTNDTNFILTSSSDHTVHRSPFACLIAGC